MVFLNIALIVLSVALTVSIVLQSKGSGLGSLGGSADPTQTGGTRRGLDKTLFQVTIGLSAAFFIIVIVTVFIVG
ncbi:MAG: preprotein translocase subunit SecG [Chloroflexi bacterium]|nr:preprotein translocase subunit SecG [Chloroflexota bacterium]